MDDFFLPPPTSPDSRRSPWDDEAFVWKANFLLDDSTGAYGEDTDIQSLAAVRSGQVDGAEAVEGLIMHEHGEEAASSFIGGNLAYDIDEYRNVNLVEIPSHNDSQRWEANGGTDSTSFQQNGDVYSAASEPLESASPFIGQHICSSMESSLTELPALPQHLADAYSTMWPPSYSTTSQFVGQTNFHDIRFQEVESGQGNFNNGKVTDVDSLDVPYFNVNEELQDLQNISFSSSQQMVPLQIPEGESGLHNLHPSSFPRERIIPMQGYQQPPSYFDQTPGDQLSIVQSQPFNVGCNGAVKRCERARRGEAKDPHSVSERTRRSKISVRLNELKAIVPNCRIDTASALADIIDHIKFLQLQVKAPVIHRFGQTQTGDDHSLLTNAQAEGLGNSYVASSSVEQGEETLFESEDNLALEQEVGRLLETDMKAAMQFLQDHGICLVPIALAHKILNQKDLAVPTELKKTCVATKGECQGAVENTRMENVKVQGQAAAMKLFQIAETTDQTES